MSAMPSNIDVTSHRAWANETQVHADLAFLRAQAPVSRVDREPYRPYWAVTRIAEIKQVMGQNELFINEPRPTLVPKAVELLAEQQVGGRRQAVRTLLDMDGPEHKSQRSIAQRWFMGPGVAALQKRIDTLADEYIEKMVAADGEIDFAREIAMQFPLRVIMSILGLPHGDAPFVLRMTQQLLSAGDPDLARSDQGGTDVLPEVFQYFGQILADRRANPQEDLASVIANVMIGDEAIGAIEAISYYLLVSTAGHETTAASPAGGLLAIIQHPQELDSGNRDDSVFADPYRFDIERAAQAHVGFGWGGHGCLGRQVALAEIRTFFAKLLPRLESVELAGEPRPIESNFTGGYKSLPIRYRLRAAAV